MLLQVYKKIIKLEKEVYCQLYNGGEGGSGRICSRKKGKKDIHKIKFLGDEVAKEKTKKKKE